MNSSEHEAWADADDYTWHWLLVFVLVAACVFYVSWHKRVEVSKIPPRPPLEVGSQDWYWVLRMPEVTGGRAQDDVAQKRLRQWLNALREEGFHPLTLSEANQRLESEQGLPENSVVVLFDPGHRHTYETLSPVLNELRWPVAWMSPRAFINDGDTHYVSQHEIRSIARTGWWDVRLYGKEESLWGAYDGKVALNQGRSPAGWHRLNVNPTWTKQELINRLLAERPLREPSFLTLRKIQNLSWGIVTPVRTVVGSPSFWFQAPPDERGAWLSWPGTRGQQNMELELQVTSLTGEFWVVLRSDDKAGEGVRVALANERISVEEEKNHIKHLLKTQSASYLKQPSTFRAVIKLDGSTLQISINGQHRLTLEGLALPTSSDGVVRLMIYDKITGAAHANAVTMMARPLL